MKPITIFYIFIVVLIGFLSSCDDIIEPSISKKTVTLEAPANQYQSLSYTVNFWWDLVDHARSYHLQVVNPSFASPGGLVLDTIVTTNKFSVSLNPGNYQWRVMAENSGSQTAYSTPRNFTVDASSIKQQTVQLNSPANSFLTNQSSVVFQWSSLYGATQYRFEIDTNNFVNESAVIANLLIPGQQLSFTFPKDHVYQWRVRAENDTAQALWSTVNLITYDHTPPAQVSIVAPADSTTVPLPVNLQWSAVTTATHYKLYVYKSDGVTLFSSTFPLSLSATSYSFTQGSSGTKLYWKVTALDAFGNEGMASKLKSFTLQ